MFSARDFCAKLEGSVQVPARLAQDLLEAAPRSSRKYLRKDVERRRGGFELGLLGIAAVMLDHRAGDVIERRRFSLGKNFR